jgi:hypothetical protein
VYLAIMLARCVAQTLKVQATVAIRDKARVAVVPALNDVKRHARER